MEMSNEELLSYLQQMIDAAEKRMAEMCGMQLYKKQEGFTQEDIYTLCGRDDAVATITLNPESEGYSTFGDDVTVSFVYTPKERKALEEDSSSMNGVPCVSKYCLVSRVAIAAELQPSRSTTAPFVSEVEVPPFLFGIPQIVRTA